MNSLPFAFDVVVKMNSANDLKSGMFRCCGQLSRLCLPSENSISS